jgi:hypothetical protein
VALEKDPAGQGEQSASDHLVAPVPPTPLLSQACRMCVAHMLACSRAQLVRRCCVQFVALAYLRCHTIREHRAIRCTSRSLPWGTGQGQDQNPELQTPLQVTGSAHRVAS